MENQKEITYWNIPVPKPLNDALEAAIKRDWHRTKTEFIREVVRKELERLGFKPLAEVQKTFRQSQSGEKALDENSQTKPHLRRVPTATYGGTKNE